jgi:hypothetical protein
MTASYPIPKNDNTCPDDPPHYWLNSGEHHEKLVASGRFHQPFRSRHGAGGATISIGFSGGVGHLLIKATQQAYQQLQKLQAA